MAQYFIDRAGTLTNVRRTAVGGFLVDATLARTGVMEYLVGARTIRRHNPEAVLRASLDGITTAPVTRLHPSKFVDTTNYAELVKGHPVGAARLENGHIVATLAINDEGLIRDIEAGMREVSMGYLAEHDGVEGIADDGTPYHESRVKIEWNHIAIVPAGRAGTARLQLDSADIPQEVDNAMAMKLKIRGAEVDADKAQEAIDAADIQLDAVTGERDALKDKVAELEAALAEAKSKATLDAAVEAELARRAEAERAEARKTAVAKRYPKLDLSKYAQPAIDALHDAMATEDAADPDGVARLTGKRGEVPAPAAPTTDAKPKARKPSARDRMLASYRDLTDAVDG